MSIWIIMKISKTGSSRCWIILAGFVLSIFILPSIMYAVQAQGKIYKIRLNNGREISCSQYYERNGQIVAVRSFGEVSYDKEDVAEIREEGSMEAPSSATPTIPRSSSSTPTRSKPAGSTGTGKCGLSDLWFRAELRKTDASTIDQLIAREQARIAELESQLPALVAADEDQKTENKRKLEARREEKKREAQTPERLDIRGEDVIGLGQRAAGISPAVQGGLGGELLPEDHTPAKRKMMEQELSQHRCNIYWAEQKRSGARIP
jgi:hypothetical protein